MFQCSNTGLSVAPLGNTNPIIMNVNELVDRSSTESSPMQASADPQVIYAVG